MSKKENKSKTPTSILEISREFVTEYYKTASAEDKAWIQESIKRHEKESGSVKYFAAFRSDFARKFIPELVASKKQKKTVSLFDTLREIDETSDTK